MGGRRAWVGSGRSRCVGIVIGPIRARGSLRAHRLPFLQHNNWRSDWSAIVKIDDVVIEQANAAAGNLLADRLRLDGSVEAKIGVLFAAVEVKRARAERIVDAAWQPGRVVRIDRHPAND